MIRVNLFFSTHLRFFVCSKHPKRCNSKLNCEDMPDSLNMFTIPGLACILAYLQRALPLRLYEEMAAHYRRQVTEGEKVDNFFSPGVMENHASNMLRILYVWVLNQKLFFFFPPNHPICSSGSNKSSILGVSPYFWKHPCMVYLLYFYFSYMFIHFPFSINDQPNVGKEYNYHTWIL